MRRPCPDANASIHERGQANAEFQGMGTTCSVLVLLPDAAIVAHVGDSRVYRLRGGKLEQLTFDHSLVWEMMAAGQMPRGEVASFIPKNIITRSLGPHARRAGRSGRAVSAEARRHVPVVQRRLDRPGQGRRDRSDLVDAVARRRPVACWWTWRICAAAPTTSPCSWSAVLRVPPPQAGGTGAPMPAAAHRGSAYIRQFGS